MLKIIRYVVRFIPVLIMIAVTFFSVFSASEARLEEEIKLQISRINELEQLYSQGEIKSVDEASFFEGDLQAELASGIKFNELSFIATHNSYQTESIDEMKKLYGYISELTFGLVGDDPAYYSSETLTEQLNCGIRSFEIDIETFERDGEISFTCMHSPYFEMGTSCYDFSLALKEIAMWSENNPDHLPITMIIEPKRVFVPLEDMKFFKMKYALALDDLLREGLGEKLFTPADMLRDYESFGEMRRADDWCKVEKMLGKVVIILHDCGVTEDYIKLDPSIKSQAMFPMLRQGDLDRDCASVILCNNPVELNKMTENLKEKKILSRTRSDKFGGVTQKKYDMAMSGCAQIISTDYPPKTTSGEDDYVVSFNGKTVRKAK